MELRHIRAFIAVAEELHFGRAAERLHIAQPPLSQQIRQLETHLGVRLFERNTRSVSLTSAGEAFLEPARAVLSGVEDAERAARAGGRGEYGRVTIGFAGASSEAALPVLARAVRRAHPNLELDMRGQLYANAALAKIADGSLDLGFVRLPIGAPGIEHQVVEEEELIVAMPLGHPLAAQETVALRDLAQEPFITFPADSGSSLHAITQQVCLNEGFAPTVVQSAPDSYTILALVAAGVGVTLTLTSCMHARQEDIVYRRLSDALPTLDAAIAWRSMNSSAALRAVLDVVREVYATPRRVDFDRFATPAQS
ncbi:LysR substrate-binding domain-containing protein [Agrococcus carbonis]|uniref:DNA-binding transcriptional regulator, LysR family n=1 Tax=Agrococcus carbonis TaxID=684552 RepID=A0A1H1PS70_9MICO|nr:LysR substrate-binding domain-containing protein [Agrococcus carbonis]SDS14102.1 DNA-binding transcriptional regulator, LysR family [Agrococcus carbonis]